MWRQILLLTGLCTALWRGPALALQDIGQLCWQLTPFVDTVLASVSVDTTGPLVLYDLRASWRVPLTPSNQTLGGSSQSTALTDYHFLGHGTGGPDRHPANPPGTISVVFQFIRVSGIGFSGARTWPSRSTHRKIYGKRLTFPSQPSQTWPGAPGSSSFLVNTR